VFLPLIVTHKSLFSKIFLAACQFPLEHLALAIRKNKNTFRSGETKGDFNDENKQILLLAVDDFGSSFTFQFDTTFSANLYAAACGNGRVVSGRWQC